MPEDLLDERERELFLRFGLESEEDLLPEFERCPAWTRAAILASIPAWTPASGRRSWTGPGLRPQRFPWGRPSCVADRRAFGWSSSWCRCRRRWNCRSSMRLASKTSGSAFSVVRSSARPDARDDLPTNTMVPAGVSVRGVLWSHSAWCAELLSVALGCGTRFRIRTRVGCRAIRGRREVARRDIARGVSRGPRLRHRRRREPHRPRSVSPARVPR